MRLKDKVSIITGAGSGIGEATALRFGKEGSKVVIADMDKLASDDTVRKIKKEGGEAIFVPVDVSKTEDCNMLMKKTVKVFGRIDILINNVGIYIQENILDASEENWKRIFDVNVNGIFYCCRHAVPYMVKVGKGSIVNIASEAGIVAIKKQMAYNASKAAVIMMTKSMAVDLAEYGIRVNTVCPGTTETSLFQEAMDRTPDPKEARRLLESARPANRLGRPEEIAAAILFIASDEPGYATGSTLVIDGGLTVW